MKTNKLALQLLYILGIFIKVWGSDLTTTFDVDVGLGTVLIYGNMFEIHNYNKEESFHIYDMDVHTQSKSNVNFVGKLLHSG